MITVNLTEYQKNSVVFHLLYCLEKRLILCCELDKDLQDSRMTDDIEFYRACLNESCETLYILSTILDVFDSSWRSRPFRRISLHRDSFSRLDDFLAIGSYQFEKGGEG